MEISRDLELFKFNSLRAFAVYIEPSEPSEIGIGKAVQVLL